MIRVTQQQNVQTWPPMQKIGHSPQPSKHMAQQNDSQARVVVKSGAAICALMPRRGSSEV
jgi:hypothetical protein